MSAAFIIGLADVGRAAAQVAVTYSGNAKDGSSITFTVSTDITTGKLAVTAAGINFQPSAPVMH